MLGLQRASIRNGKVGSNKCKLMQHKAKNENWREKFNSYAGETTLMTSYPRRAREMHINLFCVVVAKICGLMFAFVWFG